ncbi:GntR family transcriptional regulator [Alicyclobacillus dauci]|uniref:GntR family transcriptional regulator n=1 Tax=Alicyclobacillus dauci TaxID=1475485 RepID=A0ABY6Z2G0_9BACL|nr:GntR family transcriptional regulator [Alicyclobacillus dauci]WAH37088.1 GntR family transcriptional regulator [Alicyclobacillus dauci]
MIQIDAYESIRTAIIQGNYQPGQRLTEEFLSAELQISRTPIREAIKKLEADGLVSSLRRGVIVRTFRADDVRQIYDLRALLEGYAATHAALLRTEEHIARMNEATKSYERAIDAFGKSREALESIVENNKVFHDAVHESANNPHLLFMMSKVIVLPLVFRSFYWYSLQEIQASLEAHKQILKAIVARDPEWARSTMCAHIYKGRDHVLSHIEDVGSDMANVTTVK